MRSRCAGLWVVWFCAWLAAGCGAECIDQDGDGRGEDCEQGPDCDDSDPARGLSCELGADCNADPFAHGCACYAGTTQQCYSGPEGTRDIGQCHGGRRLCPSSGAWGVCRDEVLPALERCNDLDDDCDGIVDEGVASPCGGCDPQCYGGVWGPPAAPFEAEGAVAVTERGELTLAFTPAESRTVWVPNTGEGTVSKVDADMAREVARYRVAGATPERVAIDFLGDAWVLSPALDGRSGLSRVAGESARCRGAPLRTSAGPEQVLELGEDACVMWSGPIGESGEVARTLAVDGARAPDHELGGQLWVGMQQGQRMLELSGDDASLLREVPTPGISPFDAVFDPWGTLWVVDRAGLLARIEPAAAPAQVEVIEVPLRCYQLDSVASDLDGVLTLTGAACEDVISYDPRLERWDHVKTSGVLDTRGVAVLGEDSWVTHTAGRLSRVRREPLAVLETFELAALGASPIETTALGADSLGRLWVVSSMGGTDGAGVLTGFDPMARQVQTQVSVGRLPRPRGDVTGSRRLGSFAPEGSAQHRFDGCGDGATRWGRLHVAWLGGEGGSVWVQARWAPDAPALASASWQTLGTLPEDQAPFAVDFGEGGTVELRLTLRSAHRLGAPRIARVGLEWRCGGLQ